jgi:hypothetical protein
VNYNEKTALNLTCRHDPLLAIVSPAVFFFENRAPEDPCGELEVEPSITQIPRALSFVPLKQQCLATIRDSRICQQVEIRPSQPIAEESHGSMWSECKTKPDAAPQIVREGR